MDANRTAANAHPPPFHRHRRDRRRRLRHRHRRRAAPRRRPPPSWRSPGTTTTPTTRTRSTRGSRSIPTIPILIRYQRSEMGQGSMTALPMIITEELQCDWSKVRIEYASPNRNIRENKVYGDMFSNGSRSVRASQKKMQQVGASARERLIAAAAARWNVPAHGVHGRLERGDARPVRPHAALWRAGRRCREDHARQGAGDQDARPVHLHRQADAAHRRGRTRSTARPSSGSTRRFPDMVFAAINACPVPGGKLKSVDESPARRRARRAPGGAARRTRWRWSRPAASGAPSRRWRGCSPNGMSARPATSTARSSRRTFRAALRRAHADRAQRRRCRSGDAGRGQDVRGRSTRRPISRIRRWSR